MPLLIFRPAPRTALLQLAGLLALAALGSVFAVLFGGAALVGVAGTLTGFLVVIGTAYAVWWRVRSPQAFVTTSDYLAVLSRSGRRSYLAWSDVSAATHKTGLLGMRWKLKSAGRTVTVRDIGVAPERWGLLWHRVGDEATGRGASVRVDAISAGLFR